MTLAGDIIFDNDAGRGYTKIYLKRRKMKTDVRIKLNDALIAKLDKGVKRLRTSRSGYIEMLIEEMEVIVKRENDAGEGYGKEKVTLGGANGLNLEQEEAFERLRKRVGEIEGRNMTPNVSRMTPGGDILLKKVTPARADDELPWATEDKRATPSVSEEKEYMKALEVYCFQNDVEDEELLGKPVKEYIRRERKNIISEVEGKEMRGISEHKVVFFDKEKTLGKFNGSIPKPKKKKKKK